MISLRNEIRLSYDEVNEEFAEKYQFDSDLDSFKKECYRRREIFKNFSFYIT